MFTILIAYHQRDWKTASFICSQALPRSWESSIAALTFYLIILILSFLLLTIGIGRLIVIWPPFVPGCGVLRYSYWHISLVHSPSSSPSPQIILRCSNCSLISISDCVHHTLPGARQRATAPVCKPWTAAGWSSSLPFKQEYQLYAVPTKLPRKMKTLFFLPWLFLCMHN